MRGIDAAADASHAADPSPSELPACPIVRPKRVRKPDTRKRVRGMTAEQRAAKAAERAAAVEERWQALREDVAWMVRHGETREGIARRVGMQWETLDRYYQRRGEPVPVPWGDYALVDTIVHMQAVV